MRATSLILTLVLVLSACGQRALPLVDGGVEPDSQAPPHTTPHPGCQSNNDCPAGSYCFVKGCTGSGSCAQRPTSCPLLAISEPVCGCDGKTYHGVGSCEAAKAGVNIAREGVCSDDPACEGISCGVINDCCQCTAYDLAKPPTPIDCAQKCDAPMCQALGLAAGPFAYCVGGRCVLTSAPHGEGCTTDADCALVNDCCRCMALTTAMAKLLESQCAADCFQPACDGLGLGSVKVRCEVGAGTCRLSLK